MIIGFVSAAVFALTAAVFLTDRLPSDSRVRRAFRAMHRPLGYGLVGLSAAHLLLTLKLFYQRPLALFLLGLAMAVCAAAACLSQKLFRNNRKRGLLVHKVCGLILAVLLVAHVVVCISSFASYQRAVSEISITGVTAKGVPDGAYEGNCSVGYIQARVRVTVVNGEIATIDLLEHRNERGSAGEAVIERMLSAQTTDVDSVSGATNSSRVIRKAVENALSGG
ncbi:MAG: FMN-binding protein [Eubacteriales bacterium]|nr:FMN-binding protein [Eubacteriales bacterium]